VTSRRLGDIPGFPATGNNIKMSGATVYYFEGDRLTGQLANS
jgi:hypothetical protein